jgi:sugar fermentation stimulation protein A
MNEENIVMEICTDVIGVLRARPNRFLGLVDVPSVLAAEKVHIHDPGRLEDLLYPGNHVLLKKALGVKRKTGWDLIAGRAGS